MNGVMLLLASVPACFIFTVLLSLQQQWLQRTTATAKQQPRITTFKAMSTSAAAVCSICPACFKSFRFRSFWLKPAQLQATPHPCQMAVAATAASTKPPHHLHSTTVASCSTNLPASLPTPEQTGQLIRSRRSIYPKHMTGATVSREAIMSMLEAANWAPTHGKTEPWRFVVLGRRGIQALQDVTEAVYQQLLAGQPEQLQHTLSQLHHDRRHRWSTPSHMIAICMARQPLPTKQQMPLWEELAACACAVQNMHLVATSLGLGAYWSSWHDEARDSKQMLQFLGMDGAKGDRCWGFLVLGVVAPEAAHSYRASRGPIAHKVAFRD